MDYQERIVSIEERNQRIKARIEELEDRKQELRQAQEQLLSRTPRDTWHLWSRVYVSQGAGAARNGAQ
jgi:predicted  nucleic acid-binding Zn-ribbon protein